MKDIKNIVTKESQRSKVETFVKRTKTDIAFIKRETRKEVYVNHLQSRGKIGADVISIAVQHKGARKEMIRIVDPDAKFFEEETYATVCRGRSK